RGYDFGFEQSLWQKRVSFGVTWFRNDITNLIVFGPPPTFTFENIGRAKTHGIESFAAVQVTDRLQLRADYTYTIAIDADTGAALIRRPKDKVSVSAVWQPTDKLTLSATALWVSGWFDFDRFGLAPAPFKSTPYNIVNLAANYVVGENVTLFGRIDNLFDQRYQDPVGFERPGFGIYCGVRLTK
ncbi:MAG TPA: TonB-dependent receptor, partial [Xanthobacteraceae bacterium]|nr:TonB-dependent receptor [Xanthobacteraceae bacterium]